jgi:hypothetical protein
MPNAAAAAAAPLEPPGVTCGFHGLSERPCRSLSVNQRSEKDGALLRPTITAPARLKFETTGASVSATRFFSAATPPSVAPPATSTLTLMEMGTPCNGPTASPRARARSPSSAAAIASACSTCGNALNLGFTSSMRARTLAAASRQDTCLSRISAASSVAFRRQRGTLVEVIVEVLMGEVLETKRGGGWRARLSLQARGRGFRAAPTSRRWQPRWSRPCTRRAQPGCRWWR